MTEPRFGNRRGGKKQDPETPSILLDEQIALESRTTEEVDTDEVPYKESPDDILSFMQENQKKKKVIPMRQVIFRLPVDKFDKIEKAIGNMSIQQFYSNLTDFYLSKMDGAQH